MNTLPDPIALCLEDLDAPSESRRYLQCVALAGGMAGLTLDDRGDARWRTAAGVAVELWVSADSRLMLFRQSGAIPITVRRAGRSLDAPAEQPVVLLDQDQLDLGGRRLRVHVHGTAPAVAPPAWLVDEATSSAEPTSPAVQRAAAAAVAVGMAVAGAGCDDANVDQPKPEPSATTAADTASASQTTSAAPPAEPSTEASASASADAAAPPEGSASAATSSTAAPSATQTKPIEVRTRPPKPAMPPKDKGF